MFHTTCSTFHLISVKTNCKRFDIFFFFFFSERGYRTGGNRSTTQSQPAKEARPTASNANPQGEEREATRKPTSQPGQGQGGRARGTARPPPNKGKRRGRRRQTHKKPPTQPRTQPPTPSPKAQHPGTKARTHTWQLPRHPPTQPSPPGLRLACPAPEHLGERKKLEKDREKPPDPEERGRRTRASDRGEKRDQGKSTKNPAGPRAHTNRPPRQNTPPPRPKPPTTAPGRALTGRPHPPTGRPHPPARRGPQSP